MNERAFEKCCDISLFVMPASRQFGRPYALAFPAIHQVDWSDPVSQSDINASVWRQSHAKYCKQCSAKKIHDTCYFKLLYHWLCCGFDPPQKEGFELTSVKSSSRDYVDNWLEEKDRCQVTFVKW